MVAVTPQVASPLAIGYDVSAASTVAPPGALSAAAELAQLASPAWHQGHSSGQLQSSAASELAELARLGPPQSSMPAMPALTATAHAPTPHSYGQGVIAPSPYSQPSPPTGIAPETAMASQVGTRLWGISLSCDL